MSVTVQEINQVVTIDDGINTYTVNVVEETVSVVSVGIQGPAGASPITVSSTAPSSPVVNALWVDTTA